MFGYSVREVSKNSTPPLPSFPSFLGGGGSGPPGHNFLQKVLIIFLNFIFQGHFGTCRAENCTFRTYTMKYWAKQATFWHKQGGVLPVFCWLLWSHIAVTEDLPPLRAFILALGVQESSKTKFFDPP